MKKLLKTEFLDGRIEKTWLHFGEDGRLKTTVETIEEVDQILDDTRFKAQAQNPHSDFKYKASIPRTLLDDIAKQSGLLWGVSTREAFAEIMQGKSTRAQRVMRMLTEGRDYRKLQAKHYA